MTAGHVSEYAIYYLADTIELQFYKRTYIDIAKSVFLAFVGVD